MIKRVILSAYLFACLCALLYVYVSTDTVYNFGYCDITQISDASMIIVNIRASVRGFTTEVCTVRLINVSLGWR